MCVHSKQPYFGSLKWVVGGYRTSCEAADCPWEVIRKVVVVDKLSINLMSVASTGIQIGWNNASQRIATIHSIAIKHPPKKLRMLARNVCRKSAFLTLACDIDSNARMDVVVIMRICMASTLVCCVPLRHNCIYIDCRGIGVLIGTLGAESTWRTDSKYFDPIQKHP